NETLPREEMAEEMVEATNQLALVTTSYAASPHPDLLLEIDTAGQDFTLAQQRFAAVASTPELTAAALTVARQFEDLVRQSQRIVAAVDRRSRLLLDENADRAAADQSIDAYLARFHVLREAIDGTLDHVIVPSTDADVERAQSLITDEIQRTRLLSLFLGLAAALIIVGAGWFIERRVAQPARRLVAAAEALARGATHLPPIPAAGKDELGTLTEAFNEMMRRQSESRAALEEANREMAAQNERLRELDRLKDHFVATVSHELRTPLTSIVGYTELLVDGSVGELTPDQIQFLQVVSRNGHRLQRMVDDLLLAAKIEAGTLHLEKAPFDLGRLLEEAVETALPVAEDKGVGIVLQSVEHTTMVGDRGRLGQAIDNLLNNAIKFTPPRGTVTLGARLTDEAAAIEVTDSGMGIPEDELEHIFDRFYRSSNSGSVPGTGIGLSIVSFVAEAHDGAVKVRSEVGKGSTFVMVMPLDPPALSPHDQEHQYA
ncbi:MAG TPA: HAMP domain-containing sensor histidine kinase, partial [Acidimicrobiia bacterium]|nr:HAMP domain-containing sensor histidine kinase [Acidimicrobiia bacterium]